MQALTTAQPDGTVDRGRVAPMLVGSGAAVLALGAMGHMIVVVLVVSLAFAAAAAIADVRTARLPDALVALTAVGPVVFAVTQLGDGYGVCADVIVGGALCATPLLVLHLVSPAAMGFGDVKFAAALGANLGLLEVRMTLVALCVASLTALVLAAVGRRTTLAFGPPLLIGATITAVLSPLVERVA